MLPTKQTILHDPDNGLHGNCLSAVIASLLHLPIEQVPLFVNPDTWVKDLNAWLKPFGLAYCMIEDFDCHIDAYGIKELWHEISGNTSRSTDIFHACVAKDGQVAFDPHPDNTGLTKITCHGFFIALEPWQTLRMQQEILELRKLLCSSIAGRAAYTDDGELQDSSVFPFIDFLRDTPQEITVKLCRRSLGEKNDR